LRLGLRLLRSENGGAGNDKAGKYQHYNGKDKNAKPSSIAFHGTPIAPVTQNGRAARTVCDSTTRLSEDKANPISALAWYREARANPSQFSVMPDPINMRNCTLLDFYPQIGFKT
jgi:hypothetical protein